MRSLANVPIGKDFAAFAERWAHPLQHIVFTAHPTFLLNDAQSDAVATAASQGEFGKDQVCVADHSRESVTLDYEHGEAMAAISRAAAARDRLSERLFEIAAQAIGPINGAISAPCPFVLPHGLAMTWTGAPISAGPPACITG